MSHLILTQRATPVPTRVPASTTAYALKPVSAVSFDPYGSDRGENNQQAAFAIDNKSVTAWSTAWYTNAHFGNLKPGTGLLLDMGRTVLITRVQLLLGSTHGANLQIRIGTAELALNELQSVASATDAGGAVYLPLAEPTHARHLLVWFTKLPEDASGTFQATVHNISIEGRT